MNIDALCSCKRISTLIAVYILCALLLLVLTIGGCRFPNLANMLPLPAHGRLAQMTPPLPFHRPKRDLPPFLIPPFTRLLSPFSSVSLSTSMSGRCLLTNSARLGIRMTLTGRPRRTSTAS